MKGNFLIESKIAHIGNTSGVAISLAKEQSKNGLEVEVFVFNQLKHKQFGGTFVGIRPISDWNGRKRLNPFFLWHQLKFALILREFNIWHYHSPYGRLKRRLEQINKGHKYLKHYHGTDLRDRYDSDFCLVSTPDLLQFAPNGIWLPNPLDLEFFSNFRTNDELNYPKTMPDREKVKRLAHYTYFKDPGHEPYYEYYREPLKYLEDKGVSKVIEIYNLPYEEAIRMHSNCDVTIGKIEPLIGWFGKFELEGMALGKPVICYVSDELYEKYRPPVFRTTKDTFKQDLEYLLEDEATRHRLAKEGREYVQKNHDVREIVKKLEYHYQKI